MHNEIIETIKKHGIDYTAKMLAEYLNQKIQTEDVAVQFVLEEIEAASQGSEIARQFAINSGYEEDDYKSAMYNSFEEVEDFVVEKLQSSVSSKKRKELVVMSGSVQNSVSDR